MKRKTGLTIVITVLAVLAASVAVSAQKKESRATSDMQSMMERFVGMMKQSGMSPEMIRQWQSLMATPLMPDDPVALYARGTALGLSEAQKKKLLAIQEDSRRRARAVLTAQQRRKVDALPRTPQTMMEMCRQMGGRMMPMMQGQGRHRMGGSGGMCR